MQNLSEFRWFICHISIVCHISKKARINPLFFINAVLKRTIKNTNVFFHPITYTTRFKTDVPYAFFCIFPSAEKESAETALQHFTAWFTKPRNNFSIESIGELQEYSTDRLFKEWQEKYPLNIQECCLNFITPLPFTSKSTDKQWVIDAPALGKMLIRRVEILLGELPEEKKQEMEAAWKQIEVLPFFWSYLETTHWDSFKSRTEKIQGYSGPLFLKGNLKQVLPLLLICSHINLGKNFNYGLGAYTISPPNINALFDNPQKNPAVLEQLKNQCINNPTEEEALQIALSLFLEPALKRVVPLRDYAESDPSLSFKKCLELLPNTVPPSLKPYLCESDFNALSSLPLSRLYPDLARTYCLFRLYPVISDFSKYNVPPFLSPLGLHIPKNKDYESIRKELPNVMEQYGFLRPEEDDFAVPVENSRRLVFPPLERNIHIFHQGASVGLDTDAVTAKYDGKELARIPFGHTSAVILHGAGSITLPLIRKCMDNNIPIVIGSSFGYYTGGIFPETPSRSHRIFNQLRAWDALEEKGRLQIAQALIRGKIINQLSNLVHHPLYHTLQEQADKSLTALQEVKNYSEILGIEGNFAHIYFRIFNDTLPQHFYSYKREQRSKKDYWNTLLDFASTLLFNTITMTIRAEGMDPHLGFLHRQHTRYATLSADIQELFRADTDMMLKLLIMDGKITDESFTQGEKLFLTIDSKKAIIYEYETLLQQPVEDEKKSLMKIIQRQVHNIRLWLCFGHPLSLWIAGSWQQINVPSPQFHAEIQN